MADMHISASQNGFVHAAWQAYSQHHHLIIRPEDVWFAILTQLSFYINAHAEELRAFFVPHQDKKDLEAVSEIADFGYLALQMTDLLAKNVNDPNLRDWVMPDFSTTTYHDKVVGAVLFMGAMQAYFSYHMTITCGLPSVTLLGELEDWLKIEKRLEMIPQLGKEATHFANMLRPVLRHMILTFEEPASDEVNSFWNRIVHHNHVGSGTDFLSGWLTAFCYWDDEGKAKGGVESNKLFDDVLFPDVDIDKISLGFASVPVKVDDMGHKYDATMVAGSVGIAASSSNQSTSLSHAQVGHPREQQVMLNASTSSESTSVVDTLQPHSGWWIYETEPAAAAEAREAEKRKLDEELERIYAEEKALDDEERMKLFDDKPRFDRMMQIWRRQEKLMAF